MMEKDSNSADISAKDTVRKHNLTHTKHSMMRYINKQKATINYQNCSSHQLLVYIFTKNVYIFKTTPRHDKTASMQTFEASLKPQEYWYQLKSTGLYIPMHTRIFKIRSFTLIQFCAF